jgi:Domain of unknown function (DUF3854)
MRPHLDFLLSVLYDHSPLADEHLADLRCSGLTVKTIQQHKIRSIPPAMIRELLGFDLPSIRSAMLIPFPDPAGGFMDHVRMKVFPPIVGTRGTVKYLQPRGSATRLFFPKAVMREVAAGMQPLWLVEGEKKALALSQLGLPTVGFCGIEGWHLRASTDLADDFRHLTLAGRIVELMPDGDVAFNRHVHRGATRFVDALEHAGARVRLVKVPCERPV